MTVVSLRQQVVEASVKQLLVLAAGSGMDTARAEAAFLRRVGAVFVDRGLALAVAPADCVRPVSKWRAAMWCGTVE